MIRSVIRTVSVGIGFVVAATVYAPAAHAGCPPPNATGSAGVYAPVHLGAQLYHEGATGGSGDDVENADIVGLWQVTFVARNNPGIPDGTVVDAGYVTWHSDGTELMNSGRPPLTGSVCMGVWKRTGPSHYELNHVALSWDGTGQNLVGPANIKEEVTVDRSGDRYTGRFTIDQFDTSGNLLAHIAGELTGVRIKVDD